MQTHPHAIFEGKHQWLLWSGQTDLDTWSLSNVDVETRHPVPLEYLVFNLFRRLFPLLNVHLLLDFYILDLLD